MNKNIDKEFEINKLDYIELAKLVKFTTWLESTCDELGGEGNGLWEKFNTISHTLPTGLEKHIITIAEVRNESVHFKPNLNNINNIKEISTYVKDVFENKLYLNEKSNNILFIEKKINKNFSNIKLSNEYIQMRENIFKEYRACCTSCGTNNFKTIKQNITTYSKYIKQKLLFKRITQSTILIICIYLLIKLFKDFT